MKAETRIGPYEIVRRLGSGGMSEVLLATERGPQGFERRVVLKRLLPRWEGDPVYSRVLAREAMAHARLSHPAIVRLYDFLEVDRQLVIVLEHVDGISLARLRGVLQRANERPIDDLAALYIGYRLFDALSAAHGAFLPDGSMASPVVHRDISPGNVLIPWDGFVKLSDFGIAKILATKSEDTTSGFIKGTFGYMAPEQVVAQSVTTRTDVYLAALIVRELLTQTITFQRGELNELEFLRTMALPNLVPIAALRPDLSPILCEALTRATMADPSARSITAADMTRIMARTMGPDGHKALVRIVRRARTLPEVVELFGMPSRDWISAEPHEDIDTMSTNDLGRVPSVAPVTGEHPRPDLSKRRGKVAIALSVCVALAAAALAPIAYRLRTAPSIARHVASATPHVGSLRPRESPPIFVTPVIPAASASVTSPLGTSSSVAFPSGTSAPVTRPGEDTLSKRGRLSTPSSMAGHRVFVDGRAVCPSGQTVTVACGRHEVRVGSAGRLQIIDVPCGGSVDVAP